MTKNRCIQQPDPFFMVAAKAMTNVLLRDLVLLLEDVGVDDFQEAKISLIVIDIMEC